MNTVPRIVVGVDGFESSTAALRWAIHQAKLTGAVVDAVTTWHIPPGSGLVPAVDMPDYQDDARIVLTEAITEMCTIDTDVVVRPRVVEGQAGPVKGLLRARPVSGPPLSRDRPAHRAGHRRPAPPPHRHPGTRPDPARSAPAR